MQLSDVIVAAIGLCGGSVIPKLIALLRGRTTLAAKAVDVLASEVRSLRAEVADLKRAVGFVRSEKHWNGDELNGATLSMEVAVAKGCNCGIPGAFLAGFRERLAKHRAQLAELQKDGRAK